MQVEVKVPQLSESVSEATLVAWRKKPGEAVKRDENLIDIETDKVVLEIPAPADGVLARIVKADGESVASGDLIAVIDTDAKATVAAAPAARQADAPRAPAPAAPPARAAAPAAKAASPSAAKIAAEKNVDTSWLQGSGRDGRVTKGDVLAADPAPAAAPSAPAASARPAPAIPMPTGARTEQRVPMSRLRQRVAERLVQSQSTAAILTTFNEANMAPVMELRARYKDRFEKEHGVKLGFMSFFVKAAVHALRKYPVVNASIDGTDIVYHGYYDIGIAVGSERGLVVPILRNADLMS
ncbi:MAG TPA: 2-oxo acid dehydrogenase subunit E2, partial [Usitatibacter sp.]|nr:2-oxo acid dehydrogenase subunit E2 [Usitatibacter sp.]